VEMTRLKLHASLALAAAAFIAIFVVSFAVTPLAIARSAGSDYPMEIIRAHTVYQVADPVIPVQVGLGVQGNR